MGYPSTAAANRDPPRKFLRVAVRSSDTVAKIPAWTRALNGRDLDVPLARPFNETVADRTGFTQRRKGRTAEVNSDYVPGSDRHQCPMPIRSSPAPLPLRETPSFDYPCPFSIDRSIAVHVLRRPAATGHPDFAVSLGTPREIRSNRCNQRSVESGVRPGPPVSRDVAGR